MGAAAADASAAPGAITVPVGVYVIFAVIFDIIGFWLHVQGIKYAGSALFQVIYASVTIFAALGSWAAHTTAGSAFLVRVGVARYLREPSSEHAPTGKHNLNALQGLGISVVLGGLALAALAEGPARSHDHRASGDGAVGGASAAVLDAAAQSAGVVYGLACSVLCAMCYGGVYTLAELLMSQPAPPRAQAVAGRVGVGICLVLGSYAAVAVAPRGAEILAHIREAGLLSARGVALGYAVMVLSAVAHSITYFLLLGSAGAVATGIMQAARAVGVFFVSAVLFCNTGPMANMAISYMAPMLHESQCFTVARGVSAVLVCGGILVFSVGKAKKAAAAAGAAEAHDAISIPLIPSMAAQSEKCQEAEQSRLSKTELRR
jgi:hypothetical protein